MSPVLGHWLTYISTWVHTKYIQCVVNTNSSLQVQMSPVLGQWLTYMCVYKTHTMQCVVSDWPTCMYTKYIQCVVSDWPMCVCIQNTMCGQWLTYVCAHKNTYKVWSGIDLRQYMCVYKMHTMRGQWLTYMCVYKIHTMCGQWLTYISVYNTKYIKYVVSDWPTCVYTKYMNTMCAKWFTYLQNTYNVELKKDFNRKSGLTFCKRGLVSQTQSHSGDLMYTYISLLNVLVVFHRIIFHTGSTVILCCPTEIQQYSPHWYF